MPEDKPTDRARRSKLSPEEQEVAWQVLCADTLTWCRDEIRRRNPGFDLPNLEGQLKKWTDDTAIGHWRAVRDALANAVDYLADHPEDAESSYGAMLHALLSAPCLGNDGSFGLTVGERLGAWRRPTEVERRVSLATSVRVKLVRSFTGLPNMLWWERRPRETRDLAMLSLLAGCVPEAAKNRLWDENLRPIDVVRCEERAIGAALSNLKMATRKDSKDAPGAAP